MPKSEVYQEGWVEGQPMEKVLLDTGCLRTMVRWGPGTPAQDLEG